MGIFGQSLRIGTRVRRRLAAAGAALLLLVQLVSAAYVAHEADHGCTGEGCPTCASLQQCVSHFQATGSGLEPAVVLELPHTEIEAVGAPADVARPAQTLVSLKIQMNE